MYNLISKIKSQKNKIFLAINSKDKDFSTKIVSYFENIDIPIWAMYDKEGKATNAIGNDHKENSRINIENSCLFLLLVTENSCSSLINYIKNRKNDKVDTDNLQENFLYTEIERFKMISDESILEHKFLVVTTMDLESDDFQELCNLLNDENICGKNEIKVKLDESNLNETLANVLRVYFKLIKDNTLKINRLNYFSNVAAKLVQDQLVEVRTVSEDIIESGEAGVNQTNTKLKELYILTDELKQYDMNAFSKMIIASNLVSGTKYFYFTDFDRMTCDMSTSEANEIIMKEFKESLKHYIIKDEVARQEVANIVRIHYAHNIKLLSRMEQSDYFDCDIEGKLASNLKCDPALLKSEIEDVLKDDKYKELKTCFTFYKKIKLRIPKTFIDWINGNNNDTQFIERYLSFYEMILEKTNNKETLGNNELYNILKDLKDLIDIENYLNDKKEDKNNPFQIIKIYSNLFTENIEVNSSIMSWFENEVSDKTVKTVDEIISDNLHFIKYDRRDMFIVLNSFALYYYEGENNTINDMNAVWYTTATNCINSSINERLAITRLCNKDSRYLNEIILAFKYLTESEAINKCVINRLNQENEKKSVEYDINNQINAYKKEIIDLKKSEIYKKLQGLKDEEDIF